MKPACAEILKRLSEDDQAAIADKVEAYGALVGGDMGMRAKSAERAVRDHLAHLEGQREGFLHQLGGKEDFALKGETEGEVRAREALEAKADAEKKQRANAPSEKGFALTGSDRNADVAEAHGQKPMFSRGERANEPAGIARNVVKRLGIDARVAATEADLPAHLREQIVREGAEGDVRGVYDATTGHVWLVDANIKNEGEAIFTAVHESAHRGLVKLFGNDLKPILDHIYRTNDTVQQRADAIVQQHGYARLRATEEVLADMALRGQAKGLKGWERFVEFVRQWLARAGYPLKVSDEMAEFIAGAAAEAGKTGRVTRGEDVARFHQAYHGSPHDFDRFDTSKIGTGEGVQAYGHGLYFAGRKQVAEHYRNVLGKRNTNTITLDGQPVNERQADKWVAKNFGGGLFGLPHPGMDAIASQLHLDLGRHIRNGTDPRPSLDTQINLFEHRANNQRSFAEHVEEHGEFAAYPGKKADFFRTEAKKAQQAAEALQDLKERIGFKKGEQMGRLYEVELAPKEDEYLDWDKGLTQQSESVKTALRAVGIAPEGRILDTGRDAYKELAHRAMGASDEFAGRPEARASAILAKAGIPGIKYLDGSSRNAGEGHHNFVIFDDKHVEVKAKFSRASTAAAPSKLMGVAAQLREGLSDESKQQEIARGGFRAALATLERRTGEADAALDRARRAVDAIAPADRWQAMHEFQTGGVEAVSDARMKPVFEMWKANVDERAQKIQSWDEGYLKEVLPHYFSQMWKDPDSAVEWYQRMMGKGPLEGGRSFLKKRAYASYQEGMSWKVFSDQGDVHYFPTEKDARAAAGANDLVKPPLEPVSQNFIDIAQLSLQQMDKFIAMHEFRQWLKEEKGWVQRVKRGDREPTGYARVDDPAFRAQAVFPITDKETGKPDAAAVTYDYMVPALIAKDLNNYLSNGLYQFGFWRSFRYAQNLLLSARLGFSAFHAGFTTMDTLVSHTDVGARYLLQGDVGKALTTWTKALTSPLTAPIEGRKLLKQFYGEVAADPDTAAVLDFLTQGGARGRMNATDFNNSWATLKRAWADGKIGETALHALPAVMEGVMRPIMHYLVPWQKMTAKTLLAKFELDSVAQRLGKKPGQYKEIVDAMGEDAMRQIAYKVVQQVDDRLGQVAYDNLFWNKFAKDIAQASIQSVGWNVGTANVILGGAKDVARLVNPEELLGPLDKEGKVGGNLGRVTGRLSYLVALNLTVGTMGAMLQYLMTGESAQDLRDYFFPRTGRKNPDGSDERISMPSYIKDEYALSQHPVTTIQHKLHPTFSMVAELLKNEDFYGTQIVNPDDPWTKVAAQAMNYFGKSVMPYAVQNLQQNRAKGSSTAMQAAPFIGITPAPASVSRTPFEAYVAERYAQAFHSTQTPEGAEKAQARRDAIAAIKAGRAPDLTPFAPGERMSIFTAARTPIQQQRFARLSLPAKLSAWDRATPDERAKYNLRGMIARDFATHQMTVEPDVRTKALQIMRAS